MARLTEPQKPLVGKAYMEAHGIDLIKVHQEPPGLDGRVVNVRFTPGNCYTSHPLESKYGREIRSQKDVEDFVRWCVRREKP